MSQPADRDAMDAWIAGLPDAMTVLRVTPQVPNAQPAPAQPVVTRGTDVHEAGLLSQARATMDALRQAIIAQYADEYGYEEPAVEIAVPEGMTAYLNDRNAQGDNHDTTYLMTGDFTLDSDDDFVVVYGVNHSTTGKAVYSNAILYARPMLNGVCSVYDGLFEGVGRRLPARRRRVRALLRLQDGAAGLGWRRRVHRDHPLEHRQRAGRLLRRRQRIAGPGRLQGLRGEGHRRGRVVLRDRAGTATIVFHRR